jgi:manganese/iron transport system ATP-binding protein
MAPRSNRIPHPAAPGTPIITVDHLTVNYRDTQALRNINLTVRPGHLVGIFGPNGAGKSTLMKAMLGLIPVVTGRVTYGDDVLAHRLDRVAYVPQRSQIDWTFPATVWDVVMMGRVKKTGWLNRFSATSRQIAKDALDRVGMVEFRDRPIGALSGGQQQRVFLARALAQEADIFCFDEPFVGVDQKTEAVIFQIFHELADAGKTILVVNHDLGESIANFDQLILLNKELIAAGPRDWVLTRDNMTRAYGGHIGFFGHVA